MGGAEEEAAAGGAYAKAAADDHAAAAGGEGGADGKPPAAEGPARMEVAPISYFKLFCTADRTDVVLMVVATVGSVANGCAWPVFTILFASACGCCGCCCVCIPQPPSHQPLCFSPRAASGAASVADGRSAHR